MSYNVNQVFVGGSSKTETFKIVKVQKRTLKIFPGPGYSAEDSR